MSHKDVNDESQSDIGLFNEYPEPDQKHINNYLVYIGSCFFRFRSSLLGNNKYASGFGENILRKYFGKTVSRKLVKRMEDGNPQVSWGAVAATLYEMGVVPEIISVLERGRSTSSRYMKLVHSELRPEVRESIIYIENRLKHKALMERQKK